MTLSIRYNPRMVKKVRKRQIFAVLGVCTNNKGEVLLTLRHDPRYPDVHHKWQFPGGEIEFGETPPQALIRELKEEIGCQVEIIKLIPYVGSKIFKYPSSKMQIIMVGYLTKIVSGTPQPKDKEVAAIKWIKPKQIDFSECLDFTKQFLHAAGLIG